MKLVWKLAWRNIWRNRRRSIITILAVTFAVMLSIAMRGIQLGTYEVNIRHMVELFAGYLQIQRNTYQTNPTLQKNFHVDERIDSLLRGSPAIQASTPRIVGDGLVSYQENSQGTVIYGVDPAGEAKVDKIVSRVVSGRFLTSSSGDEIVLGDKLMENLKAKLGDQVVVLAQGVDGSLGNLKYTIVGTVKTGLPDIDRSGAFIGLKAAQDLLVMWGRVNLIAVRLQDLSDIGPTITGLRDGLEGTTLTALPWNEIMPDFEQSIRLDNVSGILMLAILIIVVAFGITNTVLMSVTERFREFGIILSVGMPQRKLATLVALETLIIVVIGLVLGNILAYGINTYFMHNPIIFGGEYGKIYAEYGFLPRIESTIRLSSFLNTTLSVLGISVLATLYPIAKVLKLEPLKGIRYT